MVSIAILENKKTQVVISISTDRMPLEVKRCRSELKRELSKLQSASGELIYHDGKLTALDITVYSTDKQKTSKKSRSCYYYRMQISDIDAILSILRGLVISSSLVISSISYRKIWSAPENKVIIKLFSVHQPVSRRIKNGLSESELHAIRLLQARFSGRRIYIPKQTGSLASFYQVRDKALLDFYFANRNKIKPVDALLEEARKSISLLTRYKLSSLRSILYRRLRNDKITEP